MTFLDRLFTISRNRSNKQENGFKLAIEPLRSSVFDITKDQIRVVLFRECDRRGRKLLFDSNAVEKLPLGSPHIQTKEISMCKVKPAGVVQGTIGAGVTAAATGAGTTSSSEQNQNGKFIDFVEVTNSHGYKYKKPCSDVTLLGEMIFGSVAMVFKGGNTCKVHSLASPKCVMFTNIVHAPGQCHYQLSSDHHYMDSGPSSGSSINEYSNEDRTSSSDSKLYRCVDAGKSSSSTYPCMRHQTRSVQKKVLCDVNCSNSLCAKRKTVYGETIIKTDCLEELSYSVKSRVRVDDNSGDLETFHLDSNRNCEKVMCDNSRTKTSTTITSTATITITTAASPSAATTTTITTTGTHSSGTSESSLSCSTKKTDCKCDSSDNFATFSGFYECNKDAFSNANSLNSSLGSLRRRWMQSCSSSVDEAGSHEETDNLKTKTRTKLGMGLVIDLTNNLEEDLEKFLFNHTIVIESILNKLQSSIQTAYVKKENFVDLTHTAFVNCQQSVYELITGGKYSRPMWLTLSAAVAASAATTPDIEDRGFTQFEENIKDCRKQDTLNNVKLKFLNDFCDVLVKFDTKDTNFFVSTLLTAVLTYHLSWVTGIGESDVSLPQHKLQSVMQGLRPYNPIWAQMNDLNGILGSPLKSARTVIAGRSDASKNNVASIVQVLMYFIRCYNVIENVYDFDFDEVTTISQTPEEVEITTVPKRDTHLTPQVDLPEVEVTSVIDDKLQTDICLTTGEGMKRSKSCLSRLGEEEDDDKCYVCLDDADAVQSTAGYLCVNVEYGKRTDKLIKVPSKTVVCQLEENLSPDEGYDTVDSCAVAEAYPKKNARSGKEDDVLFVLGENEELVSLKRVVVTESSKVDLEKEDYMDDGSNWVRSESINIPVSVATDVRVKKCRTLYDYLKSGGRKETEHSRCVKDVDVLRGESVISGIRELPMPRAIGSKFTRKRLDVSSVLGGVNDRYNSEQIIQGVLEDRSQWEKALRRDLALYAHNPVLDRNVTEALCIIGDVNTWEVSLISSRGNVMDRSNSSGVRIGMSQLVADMLESLLHICRIKLAPDFCLNYIEKKLHEIYTKSRAVAELLNSTDMCSIEYLTSRLDISVNDVPLLLSVATTHSPHISSKYGLTFT